MGSKRGDHFSGDGASPGKIFIGGLAKDTTLDIFLKHFEKYGEITDHVIMKDRHTGRPRGFGFITYADPSVVDAVIQDNHIINGKQVEIKRTIPKGASEAAPKSGDFKTKKIFVGGIPTHLMEDEFKDFFSKFGEVVEHEIIRDHATQRSRGFGFVVFDNEKVVDNILANGKMIDMAGTQVEIKKAEPKKASNSASGPAFGSDSRTHSFDEGFGGFSEYGGYGSGGYGPGPALYRSLGGFSGRYGSSGGYGGAADFGGSYGGLGGGGLGGYRGEPSFGYSSRFAAYGGGLGAYARGGGGTGLGAYARGSGGTGLGAYGRGSGYGAYGVSGSGTGYDSGPGAIFGGPGGVYGGRPGNSGSRYHPYAR